MKKIVVILVIIFLSGCNNTGAGRVSCTFVEGMYNSNEKQRKSGALTNKSNDKVRQQNVINGLANVLLSPLNKSGKKGNCN